MHGLIREQGTFGTNPSVKDLARHLYTRSPCGQVVIAAERPVVIVSLLRKEWLKLTRSVRTQRASTLDTTRIFELTNTEVHMQKLRFTVQYPPDDYPADVYVATTAQLLNWAPECRTLYVTCTVPVEQLHIITAWMPKGGLVVMCPLFQNRKEVSCAHD